MLQARGEERGFVHKRLFRGIKGFLTGGPVGAATGFLSPGTRSPTSLPAPLVLSASQLLAGGGCPPGFTVNALGQCQARTGVRTVAEGLLKFGQAVLPAPVVKGIGLIRDIIPRDGTPQLAADRFGEAVMGRFGAAIQPEVLSVSTRRCPRGAVLAVDGLCYNRRDISNKERFWPRGRRPLLTGGEMRCISIASSAATKLQRKEKQLQELGLLKKPTSRPRRAPAPQLAVPRVLQIQQE